MPQPKDGSNEPNTNIKNQSKGDSGNDPKKTDNADASGFDPSTISDEDFDKVFEDERVWKHPRFKSLNERAKQAKKYEAQQEEAERQRLEEEKKYQELAEKERARADELQKKMVSQSVDSRIRTEALKQGVVDDEAVLKLIDRSSIEVDEEGNVSGVDVAVKSLLEAKAYLKGDGGVTPNLGADANPTDPSNTKKRFKMSQVNDPEFYAEHKADIREAFKTNSIIDDTK